MSSLKEIVESSTGESREILEQLVSSTANTIRENRRLEQKNDYLSHEIRLLRKRLFGSSSEKYADQPHEQTDLSLFNDFEMCAQEAVEEEDVSEPEQKTTQKKRPGRKPLPKNLPRKIVEHDLTDEDKLCGCGSEMKCISHHTSEELDYQPATFMVIEHRCKKYICRGACYEKSKSDPEAIVPSKSAKKPTQLIPKSITTPSLLSQIVINKFCDHLPLYRQETIFKRLSIDLSRQTMSKWMLKVGEAIIPLINLLQERILDYDVSYSDETTLQVLHEPGRRAQTKSYMWCFIGGPPHQRIIIYQYHASRKGDVANDFFEGYGGAVHCDGYGGYNTVLSSPDVVGINCMAHVRRKFVEALPNGKEKGVSGYVVKQIRKLYVIESKLKEAGANQDEIEKTRQEQSKPLLESLKTYLDEKSKVVPPKSKVGEAIAYTLRRWHYLTTYLEDGRYEIDNNRAERAIKPFVMGRKAWLFCNSVNGAHTSSRLFSLIETAKTNGMEPSRYLNYISYSAHFKTCFLRLLASFFPVIARLDSHQI